MRSSLLLAVSATAAVLLLLVDLPGRSLLLGASASEFVGFRGQRYEVHGIPHSIHNLISSPRLQYNSEFVFLPSASDRPCNETTTPGQHPWTWPGTYLGQVGIRVGTDRVRIVPGPCQDGIALVAVTSATGVDGETPIRVGATHYFGGSTTKQSLTFVDRSTVHLALAEVDLVLTNADNFFTQQATLTALGRETQTAAASPMAMHGLLGQTWTTKTYRDEHGRKHFIEGHPQDYLIQDDDLFGDAFLYNVFRPQ